MLILLNDGVKRNSFKLKQVNLVAYKGQGSSAGEIAARFLAAMLALVPIQNFLLFKIGQRMII